MDKIRGKVILVTGASAGIGAGLTKTLVNKGATVVACARNVQPIEEMKKELASSTGILHPIQCDLRQEAEILAMFQLIRQQYGALHVCINNAGLGHAAPLLTGKTEDWRELYEVNVLALCICTREAIQLMRDKNIDDGHIIHISSMSAYRLAGKDEHFYGATKHGVRALTEAMRRELREIKSHIRVTSISPGNVRTEFASRMYAHDKEVLKLLDTPEFEYLTVEDVVEAVIYAIQTPTRVEVHDLLLRPTEQPN